MAPLLPLLLLLSLALAARVVLWRDVPQLAALGDAWCDAQIHPWCTVTRETQLDEILAFVAAHAAKDVAKSPLLEPPAHDRVAPVDVAALLEAQREANTSFLAFHQQVAAALAAWHDPAAFYRAPVAQAVVGLLPSFASPDGHEALIFVPLALVPGPAGSVRVALLESGLGFLGEAVQEYMAEPIGETLRQRLGSQTFHNVVSINGGDPLAYVAEAGPWGRGTGNALAQGFLGALGGTLWDVGAGLFPPTDTPSLCLVLEGDPLPVYIPWAVTLRPLTTDLAVWYRDLVGSSLSHFANFPAAPEASATGYVRTEVLAREASKTGALACSIFRRGATAGGEQPEAINHIRLHSLDISYIDLAGDLTTCVAGLEAPDGGVDGYDNHTHVGTATLLDLRGARGTDEVTLLFLLDFVSSGRLSPTGDLVLRHRDGRWEYAEELAALGKGLAIDPLTRQRAFIPSGSESNGLVTEVPSQQGGAHKLATRFSRYFRTGEFTVEDWELSTGKPFPLIGGRVQDSPYDGLLSAENTLVLTDGFCVGTCHRLVRRLAAMGYVRTVGVAPWEGSRRTDIGMGAGSVPIARSLTLCGGKVTTNCTKPLIGGSDISVSPVLVLSPASRDSILLTEYTSSTHGGQLIYTPPALAVPSISLFLGLDFQDMRDIDTLASLVVTSRAGLPVNVAAGHVTLGCRFEAKSTTRYGQIYDPVRHSLSPECIPFDCAVGMAVIDGVCAPAVAEGAGSRVSTGALVGVIVAVIVVAGGVSALCVWMLSRRKGRDYTNNQTDAMLASMAAVQ